MLRYFVFRVFYDLSIKSRARKVLQSFEKTNKGELVMDVELLEAFDDEADQGYYEDETVSPEELQEILAETSRFSGGVSVPFEKLPGQVAEPMVE